MLLAYGFIMPVWAKMHLQHGAAYPAVPLVDGGVVFLNAVVALVRPLVSHFGRRSNGQLPS
jgi:hypothetical protein